MSKNIEIEYKLLLTKQQYLSIYNDYNKIKHYEQINYYFDTYDHILKNKRYMLRVRVKNNNYEFTLKKQNFSQIGIDEYNEPIDHQAFLDLINHRRIKSEILDMLETEGITIHQLHQQYHLKTIRTDIPYYNGTLSLDANEYLGKEDFEIEYEVSNPDQAIQHFNQFLSTYNLIYEHNCAGKRHRLFNELEKQKHKRKK